MSSHRGCCLGNPMLIIVRLDRRAGGSYDGRMKQPILFAGLGVFVLLVGAAATSLHLAAQAPAVAVEPLHFHHVHLNSVNPKAAAAYYPKPFALSATTTTFNG